MSSLKITLIELTPAAEINAIIPFIFHFIIIIVINRIHDMNRFHVSM